ncbi:MAG: zinc-dependent metalloprotease [Chloroflexi bacterium]|nr:zinc-dependent metalloprotease [Chloroflexota bacterium]
MPGPLQLFGQPSRGALARGVLVGGAVAVGWAIARRYADDGDTRLIDWDTATKVATRLSGADGGISSLDRARLQHEYESMVREIEGPIADYCGTTLPLGEIDVRVLDRAEWIQANVVSFKQMFRPLEEVYVETLSKAGGGFPGMTRISRTVLSTQVGVLLGFLARKVLGQYDISLLGHEPMETGKLYFVEPNIRILERTLSVPAHDLRKWIALHEATHAHEFEVYPWVRTFLNTQLESYLRSMAEELTSPAGTVIGGLAARLLSNLRNGHNLIEAMMSPHQRQMLSRLQGLMSLAEGYSNHVMNRVGAQLLPSYEEIHQRVEHRQANRSQIEELFLRLTGLKMKMEQYALGEKFAGRVADERDVAFLNQAWQSPEWLPSEAEIRDPDSWIARMDREGGVRGRGAAVQAG